MSMFYDITLSCTESILLNLTKLEDIQQLGVAVAIDPNDRNAVVANFRDPNPDPHIGLGTITIDRKANYGKRMPPSRQVKLLYVVRDRDDGVRIRPWNKPDSETLTRGCCIALLDASPYADAMSMSNITAASAILLDKLFNRVRWVAPVSTEEMGPDLLRQFSRFRLESDSTANFE